MAVFPSLFPLLFKPRPAKGGNLDINLGPIFEREGPGTVRGGPPPHLQAGPLLTDGHRDLPGPVRPGDPEILFRR